MGEKDIENNFFENVVKIIEQARCFVGRTGDLTMCITYFEVRRMIVEEEQGGKARAKYGRKLLAELSAFLNVCVGKYFSETTLKYARKFCQIYSPSILHAMLEELINDEMGQSQPPLISFLRNLAIAV